MTDALAYVIYTSGSTGIPKGVRVSNRGLAPMLRAQIAAFGLAAGKRVLLTLSFGFDASISDIGTSLMAGATLVIPPVVPPPHHVADYMRVHAITHADLAPALLPLIDPATLPSTLETVVIGGEVCPPHVVRAWAEHCRVVNVYGPTEATICTSLGVCDPLLWGVPLIGEPLAHVRYRLVDSELWIGGTALALGYVERPDLETCKFVYLEGERWYRTGDRVRLSEKGFEFLGRMDRQLKHHGQLIAPEEIERAIRSIDGLLDCVVFRSDAGKPETEDSRAARLIALVVSAKPIRAAVREQLEAMLPPWMWPHVVQVARLPRHTSGKIDTHAAAAFDDASDAPEASLGCSQHSHEVTQIVGVFAQVLQRKRVHATEEFREMGGDSFSALRASALLARVGIQRSASQILRAGTALALALEDLDALCTYETLRNRANALAAPKSRLVEVSVGPAPPDPVQANWLITGATGFLGQRLVEALLAVTHGTIHCVVRAPNARAARARIHSTNPRINAHAGDISAPYFGLPVQTWADLTTSVSHVVHAAAAVNFSLDYADLARTNVDSARVVAAFSNDGCAKQLVYISSLAVLVATDDPTEIWHEQKSLSPDSHIFGGYVQTKVVAEEYLRRVIPSVRIIRPGLLTADARTGEHAPRCQLASFLHHVARLGCVPDNAEDLLSRYCVNITPIDYAVNALARLLVHPTKSTLVHLAGASVSFSKLVDALRKHVAVKQVPIDVFQQCLRAHVGHRDGLFIASVAYRFLGAHGQRAADLFLMTGHALDSSLVESLTGLRAPPVDGSLLDRYVVAALSGSR